MLHLGWVHWLPGWVKQEKTTEREQVGRNAARWEGCWGILAQHPQKALGLTAPKTLGNWKKS